MAYYRVLYLILAVVLITFGLGAAFLLSDTTGRWEGFEFSLIEYALSPRMIIIGAMVVALFAFGLWMLSHGRSREVGEHDVAFLLARQKRRLSLFFGLFVLASIAIAVQYARDLRDTTFEQGARLVTSVVGLKAQMIDKWVYERTLDTQFLASSLQNFAIGQWATDREMRAIVEVMLAETLAGHKERHAILLLDPAGKELASAGPRMVFGDLTGKMGNDPVTTVFEHMAPDRPGGAPYICFVVPLAKSPVTGKPAGYAVIVIDPAVDFFADLRRWPTQSKSAEMLVVRRDGDELLHIVSPTGHHIPYRMPLTDRKLPAVEAVLDGDGFRVGTDLEGRTVLTASRQTHLLGWIAIGRMDRAEVMGPAVTRIYLLVIAVIGAIALAALLTVVLWRAQRGDVDRFHRGWERERHVLDLHHQTMFATMRDIAFLADAHGRLVDANPAALRAYGYSLAEFRQMQVSDLRVPGERGRIDAQWPAGEGAESGTTYETLHLRKDGSEFAVEVSTNSYVETDGKTYWRGFMRDITLRREAEGRIVRLSRAKQSMFEATGVVLQADTEQALFDGICKAIVSLDGYKLAAIHQPLDDAERTVRLGAKAGDAAAYYDEARISWGDNELGRGPTGLALRTGEVQVNQDFSTNISMKPWRELAARHGLAASISLPLRDQGKVVAALTIYATQPYAFDPDEVELLRHLADDISVGIAGRRSKEEAEQLNKTLLRQARVNKALFEASRSLVTAGSEQELFQAICTIIVERAGYDIAGVGYVVHDEAKSVRPVAIVTAPSIDGAAFGKLPLSWGEDKYGMGPMGMAVRTRSIQVARQRGTDPTLAPWRARLEALHIEIAATLALPLFLDDEVYALLAIVSSQDDPFNAEEMAMLELLGQDISVGLGILKRRASQS